MNTINAGQQELPEITVSPDIHNSALTGYKREQHIFMDHWPKELHRLSVDSLSFQLSAEQMKALLEQEGNDESKAICTDLAKQLDPLFDGQKKFIRLNTRSPKDFTAPNLPITDNGRDAIDFLMSSMRTFDDLALLYSAEKPAYIYLREVKDWQPEQEFRCFIKNGELIAISQYMYKSFDGKPVFFEKFKEQNVLDRIDKDITIFFNNVFWPAYYSGKDVPKDVVMDIVVSDGTFGRVTLVEINPYGLSDPCCFKNYANIEGKHDFATTYTDFSE